MRPLWTGQLIGQMHNNNITYQQMADELGICKGYLSLILNGKRRPPEAEKNLNEAFNRLIAKVSDDCSKNT